MRKNRGKGKNRMFKTVKRIINWCGEFQGRLYIGFVFSLFSTGFAALPTMVAGYTLGMLIESEKNRIPFDRRWIGFSALLIASFVFLRFLFDYFRGRLFAGRLCRG